MTTGLELLGSALAFVGVLAFAALLIFATGVGW